jgi:hypothetical protein
MISENCGTVREYHPHLKSTRPDRCACDARDFYFATAPLVYLIFKETQLGEPNLCLTK